MPWKVPPPTPCSRALVNSLVDIQPWQLRANSWLNRIYTDKSGIGVYATKATQCPKLYRFAAACNRNLSE
jgi:hypothetical protein